MPEWDDLDASYDMHAVLSTSDYSPAPLAIFSSEKDAIAWCGLTGRKRALERGDLCISVVRGLDGKVWNSTDPVPS